LVAAALTSALALLTTLLALALTLTLTLLPLLTWLLSLPLALTRLLSGLLTLALLALSLLTPLLLPLLAGLLPLTLLALLSALPPLALHHRLQLLAQFLDASQIPLILSAILGIRIHGLLRALNRFPHLLHIVRQRLLPRTQIRRQSLPVIPAKHLVAQRHLILLHLADGFPQFRRCLPLRPLHLPAGILQVPLQPRRLLRHFVLLSRELLLRFHLLSTHRRRILRRLASLRAELLIHAVGKIPLLFSQLFRPFGQVADLVRRLILAHSAQRVLRFAKAFRRTLGIGRLLARLTLLLLRPLHVLGGLFKPFQRLL